MRRCPSSRTRVLKCRSKVDVVLLLDGSGSVGSSGWTKTKQFASKFVESFNGQDAQVAVILFSGPKTWRSYRKCNGPSAVSVDIEKECGIKVVQHFTKDIATTKTNIDGLQWPKSSTFTAMALEMATNELRLRRSDAQPIVLAMTDGVPISPRATGYVAHKLKRKARLMFGAVRLSRRGLQYMRSWASHPLSDNVLNIKNFEQLSKVSTMNTLIRDMCPSVSI